MDDSVFRIRLIELAERYVAAYEVDAQRRQREWDKLQEEMEKRQGALQRIQEMFAQSAQGQGYEDIAVIDMDDILGEEEDEV
jgi:hypothetical protein